MQEEKYETRTVLLEKLFDMMTRSKSIAALDATRVEKIKTKYRDATDDNIKNGIKLLEEEQQKDNEAQTKAKESFTENIEKRKQLKQIEVTEQAKSEQLAGNLLKQISETPAVKKHSSKIPIIIIVAFVVVAAWFILQSGALK